MLLQCGRQRAASGLRTFEADIRSSWAGAPAHNISVCSVQYYCFALCLPVCDMCCLPQNNSDHPEGTREKQ